MKIQTRIPCHIISGFLGVGKSSLIRQLLKQKPKQEKWAILVNEFGEVGLDGAILNLQAKEGDIVIEEVPGGCLCCAAGLPTQIALAQLIRHGRPDRLFIEPSGLAHTTEFIKQLLNSPSFREVLELYSVITLFEPSQLNDTRYTQHDLYLQQLESADLLLASKGDLHKQSIDDIRLALRGCFPWLQNKPLALLRHSHLPDALLSHKRQQHKTTAPEFSLINPNPASAARTPASTESSSTWQRFENQAHGFYSCGWQLDGGYQFDWVALMQALHRMPWLRLKAQLRTTQSGIIFNGVNGNLSTESCETPTTNKLEMICDKPINWQELDDLLKKNLQCDGE